MSRINEALRRTGEPNGTPAAEESQALFQPAWTVSADDPSAGGHGTGGRESLGIETAQVEPATSGAVLSFASTWRARLAKPPDGDPGLIEQFRRLAATLHQLQQTNGIRSVMVTSALPGDGKTLTALNLALVLAESYRYRVLLVDADLRRPSISSIADVGGGSGLSEVLRAATERKLVLVPLTPKLTLLPAGQPIANSIEALTSPRMQQILDEATARFDWVILDAPPVGPAADARLLTQMVGGTLFVIHAGQTQHADVQKAIDSLGREQLLGVVLNGVEPSPHDGYYGMPRTD